MEIPDQLKTAAPTGQPWFGALDDFLWEEAGWDPAVEEILAEAGRDGTGQDPAAAAQRLLDERLPTEPGRAYRLLRLLAEAGAVSTDHPAGHDCGPPAGIRPDPISDPLGTAVPLAGREMDLSRGRRGATRWPAGVSIVCITGPTGMGKTRLAREIVGVIGPDEPPGRLEISLSSAAPGTENRQIAKTTYDALLELLVQIGVREADVPATLAGRRDRYAAALAGRRPVILMDGVLDESQVLPLLPPGPGSVVVTSRSSLTGLNGWGAQPLPLGPLNRTGSRLVAQCVFREAEIEPDERTTAAIYQWCAGVPGPTILVSRWMAGTAKTEEMTLRALTERLRAAHRDGAHRDGAVAAAVPGLLDEDQRAVLRALALLRLPEADIWAVCLSTGLSRDRAQAALKQLAGLGLAGHGQCDRTWVVAPLAADYARAQPLAPGQLPEPEFERLLGPIIGMYGLRAKNLHDMMAASLPESLSPLRAWAQERWRAERACVRTVLSAAADAPHPALARQLAAVAMDVAAYGERREDGWRETEGAIASIARIAGDASDHQLQGRALKWLGHQARLQGVPGPTPVPPGKNLRKPEAGAEGAKPTSVERLVQSELSAVPAGPLLFGAKACRS